jgi:hypothetical protein
VEVCKEDASDEMTDIQGVNVVVDCIILELALDMNKVPTILAD